MRDMCLRLVALIDALGTHGIDVGRRLSYANPSTLSKIRRGAAFMDTERLRSLGLLRSKLGLHPNLHWVLTGYGSALTAKGVLNRKQEAEKERLERLVHATHQRFLLALAEGRRS